MKSIFKSILFLSIILLISCKGEKVEPEKNINAGDHVHKTKNQKPVPPPPKAKSKTHLNTGGMEWMTMEQVNELESAGSKKYLIDVYTEWCGWCKVMDKKTFSDPRVQEKLMENYHLIKFNAENKESIEFNGKTYEWQEGGRRGNNALAVELLKGRMSYPSLVYLDKDLNPIKISAGYKNPDQMIQELEIIEKS